MYLSAPAGDSKNSKDDFSLHYTSIIELLLLLHVHWQGCKYGKKSAFRMVPVRKEDWRFLSIKWKGTFYVDIHYLDDYFLAGPPHSSICQDHLQCFLKYASYVVSQWRWTRLKGRQPHSSFFGLELDSVLNQIRPLKTNVEEILIELTCTLAP